jgi:hypothetical protein
LENALDYVISGAVFCIIGWIATRIGPESRPGDLLLKAMPQGVRYGIWEVQRAIGFVAMVLGALYILGGGVIAIRAIL